MLFASSPKQSPLSFRLCFSPIFCMPSLWNARFMLQCFFLCSLPFVCFIIFRRKKKTPAPVPGDPRLYRAENLGRSALPRAYRGSRHVLPRADIASLGGGSAEPPQFERLRPAGALGPELLWRQQQQQQRQRQRQPLRAAGLIVCSILTLHAARSVSFCQCSTGEDRGHRPS